MVNQGILTSFNKKVNIVDQISGREGDCVSREVGNISDFTSETIVLDASIDAISEKNVFLQIPQQIFSPYRIMILVALWKFGSLDFSVLRDDIRMKSDGNLANHLRVLEDLGLIIVRKEFDGRRPKTFYELTDAGKTGLFKLFRGLQESMRDLDGMLAKK